MAESMTTKTDLMKMLAVPEDKITLHMLGVDERFRPLPQNSLAQYQRELNLPDKFILFVGTFEPRKNILGLVKAYQQIVQRMPDAPSLVLVGRRGWLFDETMAQIDSMNLGTRVIWREDISDEMLPVVYNLASVLVMPSFYEGFGFPALEAMACGTVPIVSNRSSLPEVVGDVGLQIEPEDTDAIAAAIEKVLTDVEWRKKNQIAGLERAKIFTWDKTASIVQAVYETLCKS